MMRSNIRNRAQTPFLSGVWAEYWSTMDTISANFGAISFIYYAYNLPRKHCQKTFIVCGEPIVTSRDLDALFKGYIVKSRFAIWEKFNMQLTLTLDPLEFNRRPGKDEIADIYTRLNVKNQIFISVKEFANSVGNLGHAYSHLYLGKPCIQGFVGTHILSIDIDTDENSVCTLPYDDFLEITAKSNLWPGFTYRTFRCNDKKIDRYRAVYISSKCLTITEFEILIAYIFSMFSEKPDPAVLKPSQFYFGGKGIIDYFDFTDLAGIINGVMGGGSEKRVTLYNIRQKHPFSTQPTPTISTNTTRPGKDSPKLPLIQVSSFVPLESCLLYIDLIQSKPLRYYERLQLASNLCYIKGGIKHLTDKLPEHQRTHIATRARQWRKSYEKGYSCAKCPRFQICPNPKHNLLAFFEDIPIVPNQINPISVDEAYEKLRVALQEALDGE